MNDPAANQNASQAEIELTATAFHEAGHAVMAISLGRPVQKVTIAPGRMETGGTRLGACELRKGRGRASQDVIEDEVLILLAGMVAEARFTGRYCPHGATQDLRTVQRVLESRANTQRQLERLQRRLLEKTEHLLSDDAHVAAIESIARELIEKTSISGRAVRHHFDQAKQRCG